VTRYRLYDTGFESQQKQKLLSVRISAEAEISLFYKIVQTDTVELIQPHIQTVELIQPYIQTAPGFFPRW
jgi:hypothetical protein